MALSHARVSRYVVTIGLFCLAGCTGGIGGEEAASSGPEPSGSQAGSGGSASGGGGNGGEGGSSWGAGGAGGAGGAPVAECPPPEGKIPGVGLGEKLGTIAVFFPPAGGGPVLMQKIDTSARPWGCSGNEPWNSGVSDPIWIKRYGAEPSFCCAQGYVAELFYYNQKALENAFKDGLLGDPSLYTGAPTMEEQVDLSTLIPRNDNFYCEFAIDYDIKDTDPGVTPENPLESCAVDGTPKYFVLTGLCSRKWYYHNTCWQAGAPYYDAQYPHVFGEMP